MANYDALAVEEEIIAFWMKNKIYEKAKIKNIYGGIRALPSFLKKQNKKGKKYGETDLLKNKDYYPPKP